MLPTTVFELDFYPFSPSHIVKDLRGVVYICETGGQLCRKHRCLYLQAHVVLVNNILHAIRPIE